MTGTRTPQGPRAAAAPRPRTAGPRATALRASGPGTAGPRAAGPRAAGPRSTRSRTPVAAAPSRAAAPRVRTDGPRRPVRRTRALGRPSVRLRAGFVVVLAVLALLAGRLVQLQGVQSAQYAQAADSQRLRTLVLPATRGALLDRTGAPLAMSVTAKAVFGEPRVIARSTCQPAATRPCTPQAIATALAPVLGLDAATLGRSLSSDRAFVYLARGLDPAVAAKVAALDLPGIGTLTESRRTHPSHDLAENVLGFTDVDGKGAGGVEAALQSVLAGTPGSSTAQVDHAGRVIPTGVGDGTDPVAGRDVQLTIDRDLQWYAQSLLAQQVAATEAANGTVVVMDVRTGQVLALATAPTFDPDHRQGVDPAVMGDPAISEVYEPGSVNKVITAAAALQAGVVTPDSVVEVPPTYAVGPHIVHDAEQHGAERLTFAGVLAKSSNIGTVKVAQQVGPQRLYDAMRAFGFGARTGLGLPGESRGVIPAPADWSGTSIATIPIGQGISVNALQVASVYATVANDGVRVTPSIVKSTRDGAGHLVAAPAAESHRVISSVVAGQLRAMLEGVVSDQGTAPQAAVPGYRVAGKTGTAQRVVDGHYAPGNYTSSFIGFAPADAPRFVTAVVLQGTGKKGYFGGQVAAPLFSKITAFELRSAAVAPSGTPGPVLRLTADQLALPPAGPPGPRR